MNAEQAKTTQDKVRDLQRRLYVTAKSQPTRKFHALYDKVYRPDVLRRAWENVRANRGAPGIDRTTIEDVEARGVDAFLEEIRLELQEGRYRPVPLRRVYIPKKDGRKRGLGIPVLKDRICQAAAKIVLEPVIEADFLPCSYGFRPKRNALQAMEAIRVAGNKGQSWVVDFDIKGAFDHIAHESIMQALARRVSDRRMLGLIKGWLRCGVMEEGRLRTTTAGTPQGGVISPLLANLVFHHLDEALNHLGRWATFARYADDGLVLTWTRAQAEHALEVVKDTVQRHGMELNVEKTRISRLEEGVDFLGFHIRRRPSHRDRTKVYTYRWPSRRAEASVREKVRIRMEDRRHLSMSLPELLREKVNPILRGWGSYFRYGNSTDVFQRIDRYVYQRAVIFENHKRQRRGRNQARQLPPERLQAMGAHMLTGTVRPGAPGARHT